MRPDLIFFSFLLADLKILCIFVNCKMLKTNQCCMMRYFTDIQNVIVENKGFFADFSKGKSSFSCVFQGLKLYAKCSKVYVNYLLQSDLENNKEMEVFFRNFEKFFQKIKYEGIKMKNQNTIKQTIHLILTKLKNYEKASINFADGFADAAGSDASAGHC